MTNLHKTYQSLGSCTFCQESTNSRSPLPVCMRCYNYLVTHLLNPRGLSAGMKDAADVLTRLRRHLGIEGDPTSGQLWQWLHLYLPYRAQYLRQHRGKLPPTPRERGGYTTERLYKAARMNRGK